VVPQLRSLDLSFGTLSDAGAGALLAGQPLTHLEMLDLHHHFVSEPVQSQLRAALPGSVNLNNWQGGSREGRPYTRTRREEIAFRGPW
jgi:hypothetical protein